MGAAWVVWVAAAGMTGHVDSPWGWLFLVAVAVVPPVVALVQWKGQQTMSESIREAIRSGGPAQ